MRSSLIFAVFIFQLATSASAQQRVPKEPEPNSAPRPEIEGPPPQNPDPNGPSQGKAPGVPGALAVGQNPKPAPGDDAIHFEDVADALKTLIEKIISAVGNSADSSSSSSAAPAAATITQEATVMIPSAALPCSSALDAYGSCSAAYQGTFSTVAPTAQAGCLCNADKLFDFNGNMRYCYSYAQQQTEYQSYASVIASATAACTCDPKSSTLNGHFELVAACTASSTTTSTAASASSVAVSGTGASRSTPSATNSGAVRSFGVGLGAVISTMALSLISVLH